MLWYGLGKNCNRDTFAKRRIYILVSVFGFSRSASIAIGRLFFHLYRFVPSAIEMCCSTDGHIPIVPPRIVIIYQWFD